jgi:hypothetical protein
MTGRCDARKIESRIDIARKRRRSPLQSTVGGSVYALEDAVGGFADAVDAPDSLGTPGAVQVADSSRRTDTLVSDVQRADERERGSMEAVPRVVDGDAIPAFVESVANQDEGETRKGHPRN